MRSYGYVSVLKTFLKNILSIFIFSFFSQYSFLQFSFPQNGLNIQKMLYDAYERIRTLKDSLETLRDAVGQRLLFRTLSHVEGTAKNAKSTATNHTKFKKSYFLP